MNKYEIRRLNLLKIRENFCDGKNVILANKIDKDATYVSRMLYVEGKKGRKNIAEDMAEHIESCFKLPKGWLDALVEDSNVSPAKIEPALQGFHPLISSVQAGEFSEVIYTELVQNARMIESYKKPTGDAFWLIVDGDSMTAPVGMSPSFPNGMLILVDSGKMPEHGEFCVASCDGSQATFKKFSIEEGSAYLKPLNNDYKMIKLNGRCKIIGKVIEAKWDM